MGDYFRGQAPTYCHSVRIPRRPYIRVIFPPNNPQKVIVNSTVFEVGEDVQVVHFAPPKYTNRCPAWRQHDPCRTVYYSYGIGDPSNPLYRTIKRVCKCGVAETLKLRKRANSEPVPSHLVCLGNGVCQVLPRAGPHGEHELVQARAIEVPSPIPRSWGRDGESSADAPSSFGSLSTKCPRGPPRERYGAEPKLSTDAIVSQFHQRRRGSVVVGRERALCRPLRQPRASAPMAATSCYPPIAPLPRPPNHLSMDCTTIGAGESLEEVPLFECLCSYLPF